MHVIDTTQDKPFRAFTPETDFDYHQRRLASLDTEFSSWRPHLRELSENMMPRAGRFIETERNRGGKVHQNIVDGKAEEAKSILGAGLLAGMSSPARPWMRLKVGNRAKNKFPPVRQWLEAVGDIMFEIFAESNTYRVLHSTYDELGVFGTNAAYVLPDFKDVIRLYPMTIGEFFVGQNDRYVIDTVYRKFQMSVHQVVTQFEFKNCTESTQNLYRNRNFDAWVTVAHAIEPQRNANFGSPLAKDMAFLSNYWEFGNASGPRNMEKTFLSQSGFEEFPAITPRWEVKGQDIYGHSPGMKILGDVKELYSDHFKKARAFDYQSNPPLIIPASLRGKDDWLPGGKTYGDETGINRGVRTAFDVNLDVKGVLMDIEDIRRRIDSAFFVDLFKAVLGSDRRSITAREIAEQHEEKLILLGPVLTRLQNEMLDVLVDRTFAIGIRANIFPPPPQELEGEEIRVEYVSMLAQAQKAIGVASIDRILGVVGSVAALKPGVVDKIDENEMVDIYVDLLGVPSKMIVSNENIAIIRKQKEQNEQAAQQSAMLNQASETAKNLAAADTAGKNALTDINERLLP